MTPEIGKWDFEDPAPKDSIEFSVGIFQWLPAKKGGLKQSKAVARIAGYTGCDEMVLRTARAVADYFTARGLQFGDVAGMKTRRYFISIEPDALYFSNRIYEELQNGQ